MIPRLLRSLARRLAERAPRLLALPCACFAVVVACDDSTSGAEDLVASSHAGAAGAEATAGHAAGGAAPTIEPPPYCTPCLQARCQPQLDACNADAPCRALFACQRACGADPTCFVGCESSSPLGARRAEQLRDCLSQKPCSGCLRWSHGLPATDCNACRDTACWSEYGDAQASREYWRFVDCWDTCNQALSCYSTCKKQYPVGYGFMDRWTTCLAANCKGC